MSLPPVVTMQYSAWHEEYKAGTYVKTRGGPGRIQPHAATAATLEADDGACWGQQEERAALLYGDAPSEAEAADAAAMCAACGVVDDETEGPRVEKAAPAPQATEASASREAIQPYAEFVPYPYTFDTDTNIASHVSAAPVVSVPMSDAGAQSYILPVTVPHAATNILGAQPPTNILTAAAPFDACIATYDVVTP